MAIIVKISFILLIAIAGSGCPHINSGLPPNLRMPPLEKESPVSGIYHTISPGETLSAVADTYNVNLQLLAELNNLTPPYNLKPDTKIFIPGVLKPQKVNLPASSEPKDLSVQNFTGVLAWPVEGKVITQFGVKDGVQHNGIVIEAKEGTPVRAAGGGKVGYVGNIPHYGNVVLIEHPNRLVTVYAHLKKAHVEPGSPIKAGEILGTVGASGRIDSPSLYFEVRSRSKPRNPMFFLEQKTSRRSETYSNS